MELKPLMEISERHTWILLIVPYGIETQERQIELSRQSKLLIVPYGIETSSPTSSCIRFSNF